MRLHLVAMALLLAGCVPASDSEKAKAKAKAEAGALAGAQAEVTDQATPIPGWTPPPPSPTSTPSPKVDEVAEAAMPAPDPASLCWMDYCPCDTSDPDYGYADIPLCRNLRAGLRVDDGLMSGGAAARDARRSLREFKRDNPGSF